MEIKNHPPAGGAADKKQPSALKIKINGFLINYFNYLVLVLSIIILAAFLFLFIYPKYRQISKANEEIKNNLLIEYEDRSNYLSSIRDLKKSYQFINDEEKTKIANMLPAERNTNVIITEIESIAVKNGVVLSSIKIDPQTAGGAAGLKVETKENERPLMGIFSQVFPGVGQIKIELNLSLINYLTLKNIIKTFENNLRLFDIAKINFSPGENQADLTVYSYYLSR